MKPQNQMKMMNKWRDVAFKIGAVLVLVGAAGYPFYDRISFYIYSIGACLFSFIQFADRYDGANLIVRRLRGQQILGGICLLVTAVLMAMQTFNFGFARRNEWMVALAVSCVLELYTAFRIPAELEREKKKKS